MYKAAAFSSLCIILFFTYGHLQNFISASPLSDIFISRHRWLILFYAIIFLFCTWLIFAKMKNGKSLAGYLNLTGAIIIALPLFSILYTAIQDRKSEVSSEVPLGQEAVRSGGYERPDVYYIILDMYTREDYLRSDFRIDNSKFIAELEKLGFFVADCSRSNYVQTELALSSTLNMDYLQNLAPELDPEASNMDSLVGYIKDNRVRSILEENGYKTIAFDTGYFWDSWNDASYYFSPFSQGKVSGYISPFESILLNSTALLPLIESQIFFSQNTVAEIQNPVQSHIERELFKLDKLGEIDTIKGPKFVFAHFIIPHYPFVFRADGSMQTDLGYYSNHNTPNDETYFIEGYSQQVEFINRRIINDLEKIINNSQIPPVIILQGDHGVRGENRLAILNAYYLPSGKNRLYPTISPVNSFRLVFDQYFSRDFELLLDNSYYSPGNRPFQFVETPESSPSCLP